MRSIRFNRLVGEDIKSQRDTERILFMCEHDNTYIANELYDVLQVMNFKHITLIRWYLTALETAAREVDQNGNGSYWV